jgi:multidrug efflux pump
MAFLATGQFYQQFAVTIAISTVISAINSLTLSPALAAKLLQPHGARATRWRASSTRAWAVLPALQPLLRSQRPRLPELGGASLRRRGLVFAVYAALLAGTAVLFHAVPGGFIPMQDKLYLFAGAKLPEGASLNRTDGSRARWWRRPRAWMAWTWSRPSRASMRCSPRPLTSSYIMLKPFGERTRSAEAINAELGAKFAQIEGGFAYALMPPPIQGLGNGSGYSLFLQDRAGLGYAALQQALEAFQAEIAKTPGMTYPVSSYQSNIPQLEVKVDRIKAKAQGVALTDLFQTLQAYLGSVYVNDFNAFGRVWRVMLQADADYRRGGHRPAAHAQRARRDGAHRLHGHRGAQLRARSGAALQRLSGRRPDRRLRSAPAVLGRGADQAAGDRAAHAAARHRAGLDGPELPAGRAEQCRGRGLRDRRDAGLPGAGRALRAGPCRWP